LKKRQANDSFCKPLLDFLKSETLPENEEQARKVSFISINYIIHNDLLYFHNPKFSIDVQLVIPKELQAELLEACHDDLYSGHFGFTRTNNEIRQRYFWPNMYSSIKTYCEQCGNCQTRKNQHRKLKAPMVSLPVTGPYDRVAVDLMGPLPLTTNGNKFIAVFTEYLTKYAIAEAIPDASAETVAKVFVQSVVLKFGAPLSLLTDRGANFLSELMLKICQICATRKINSSSYHPQTDGLTERFNKTLATFISMYLNNKHTYWDSFIYYALFSYNSVPNNPPNFLLSF